MKAKVAVLIFITIFISEIAGGVIYESKDGNVGGNESLIQLRVGCIKEGGECERSVGSQKCCDPLYCSYPSLKCIITETCGGKTTDGDRCKKSSECCSGGICVERICGDGNAYCSRPGTTCHKKAKNCKKVGEMCKNFVDCCQSGGVKNICNLRFSKKCGPAEHS